MIDRAFPPGAAVVAGGTGAIGGAICSALARAGCPVVIGYGRNSDAASDSAHVIRAGGGVADTAEIDLEDDATMAEAARTAHRLAGGVAAAINAAGTRKSFDFIGRVSDEAWDAAFATEVRGFLRFTRVVLPHLRANRGNLLAISTYQAGRLEPRGALSSVSKAAVERATQAIAREEGRYGVRANCLRVGWIDGGSAAPLLDAAMVANKRAEIPIGRLGRLEDVAAAACFLVSNQASFITGVALPVDGGQGL